MAVGILFFAKTPGYTDPMSYLFGDILLISRRDLWAVLAPGRPGGRRGRWSSTTSSRPSASTRSSPNSAASASTPIYLLLLCLTALTVVLLVRVVGIVMVVALLTLPAAVAGFFSRQLWQMMLLATLVCAALIAVGLGVSFRYGLPSGPVIIVLAAAAYLAVIVGSQLRKRLGAGG